MLQATVVPQDSSYLHLRSCPKLTVDTQVLMLPGTTCSSVSPHVPFPRLDGHSADVLAAAFGPPPSSPHLLVTAGADRTFKLWDLQVGGAYSNRSCTIPCCPLASPSPIHLPTLSAGKKGHHPAPAPCIPPPGARPAALALRLRPPSRTIFLSRPPEGAVTNPHHASAVAFSLVAPCFQLLHAFCCFCTVPCLGGQPGGAVRGAGRLPPHVRRPGAGLPATPGARGGGRQPALL